MTLIYSFGREPAYRWGQWNWEHVLKGIYARMLSKRDSQQPFTILKHKWRSDSIQRFSKLFGSRICNLQDRKEWQSLGKLKESRFFVSPLHIFNHFSVLMKTWWPCTGAMFEKMATIDNKSKSVMFIAWMFQQA